MKKLLITTALIAGFTTTAQAEDRWPAWYLGIHGGFTFVEDADVGGATTGEIESDIGGSFGGSLGYYLDKNIRLEGEYSFRSTDFDSINGTSTNGEQDVNLITANLYYDFDGLCSGCGVSPYVGAGLGVAIVDLESTALGVSDTDTVFAYQFLAGLNYAPETIQDVSFGLGYRYLGTTDTDFSSPTGGVDSELSSHSLEGAIRFHF